MSQKFKGIKCRRSVLGAATAPTLIKTLNFMKRRGDSAKICKYAIKRKLPSFPSSSRDGPLHRRDKAKFQREPTSSSSSSSSHASYFTKSPPTDKDESLLPRFTYEPTASAVLLLVLTNRSSLSNVSFLTSNKDEISPYRKRRE